MNMNDDMIPKCMADAIRAEYVAFINGQTLSQAQLYDRCTRLQQALAALKPGIWPSQWHEVVRLYLQPGDVPE